jgi:hypothetical protein
VAVWGLAFKPQTTTCARRPALALIDPLLDAGARCGARPGRVPASARAASRPRGVPEATTTRYGGRTRLAVVTDWNEYRHPDLRARARGAGAARSWSTGATCTTRRGWPRAVHLPLDRTAARVRVLITGAAGFLGSHLTDRFLRDGTRWWASTTSSRGAGRTWRTWRGPAAFRFLERDVSDAVRGRRPARRRAAPGVAGEPGRLPGAPDRDAAGRRQRHATTRSRWRWPSGARFFIASTSEVYGDRSCTRSPRATGGTSTRSARGAATTRRSGSPRRYDGRTTAARRGHAHRAHLQHVRAADAAERRRVCPTSSSRRSPASR